MSKENYYWKIVNVYAGLGWSIHTQLGGIVDTLDSGYNRYGNLTLATAQTIVEAHNKEIDRLFAEILQEQKAD